MAFITLWAQVFINRESGTRMLHSVHNYIELCHYPCITR